MATMDATGQTMLALAGLSYRGFYASILPKITGSVVKGDLESGLEKVRPVAKQWDLVWGPATSRMVGDQFDACAAYVVKSRKAPTRHVVAVRGTNPVSLTDWLFGDFNVSKMVEWPFGPAGATVSTSTAYGLDRLLALVPTDVDLRVATLAGKWHVPDEILGIVRLAGRIPFLESGIRSWAGSLMMGAIAEFAAKARVTDHVGTLLAEQVAVESAGLKPASLPAGGLVAALEQAANDSADPLDIVVTGHSKGGALAPALALWLADARAAARDGKGWDRTGKSHISYYAFAGPTPGNGVFAKRVVDTVGDGSCRVVNENDIVPAAWSAKGLGGVPDLYAAAGGLKPLITSVMDGLQRADLQYVHCGEPTLAFKGKTVPGRSFPQEMVYQHMDAYLTEAGLLPDVDALKLFVG
jgi:hypothetical protein